ncbi:TPA: hypothetical protein ACGUPI_004345 [Vibrio vulnificus]|nr:hypothetical protein [Vibrio vulnificus]
MAISDCLKQADKAKVFDWLVAKLEDGTLEMLFKEDDTGDMDYQSVSSFDGLVDQLEIASLKPQTKKPQYINLTEREFRAMRQAIVDSVIQSGCWENEEQEKIIALAAKATQNAEKRNALEAIINWDGF